MKKLCRKYRVPLIINDNVGVAVACGADGIHVGQQDMQAENVRALVGEDMLLGVSVQTVEQALLAEQNGADYLGVGAVFDTATKPDAELVTYDTLKRICAAVSVPVVAIGGICRHNMLQLSARAWMGSHWFRHLRKRGHRGRMPPLRRLSEEGCVHENRRRDLRSGRHPTGLHVHLEYRRESYLRGRGIEPHENLHKKFKTMSLYQAACHYQSEYGLTDSAAAIMDGVNAMVRHFYTDELTPKAGVPAFLAELNERHVKMCVATATDRPLAEAALSRCGLLSYFGEIFTCGAVGHGKDEPIFIMPLIASANKEIRHLVFEDALYALRTAKAAGYPVVGVFDPTADHDEEIRALADLYIRSFEEMEDLLHEKISYDRRL